AAHFTSCCTEAHMCLLKTTERERESYRAESRYIHLKPIYNYTVRNPYFHLDNYRKCCLIN
ncbi:tRNA uridine 5-carboxymethylaminomethyl modification enzyme MnmG, partial [Clarias magur]